ncbi:hypothetical protein [Undibacterium umbellatum]|uniref:Uncharacterized protein n=1 Tax=Undibacterium umbellatum TaxID=2762300 RepID=A0ABR6ZHV3_9BURK|nr:hypothetical protein [Undibacterium umbellatum]MBC3910930.1 hypothetical protein [Undibacterium umbellatum]
MRCYLAVAIGALFLINSGKTWAQLADCDPAVAYRAGLRGEFTPDQFDHLKALERNFARNGFSDASAAARIIAPNYMRNCVRNRYTPAQKAVGDLINEYSNQAVSRAAGKWVADLLLPKAVDKVGEKFGSWQGPGVEASGAVEGFTSMISPDSSLIKKAVLIAFAEASLEARKGQGSATALDVMRWLNSERDKPLSPLFSGVSDETKEIFFNTARSQLESIVLTKAENQSGGLWFDEQMANWLGLGAKTSDAAFRRYLAQWNSSAALSREERAQKSKIEAKVKEAIVNANDAKQLAQNLLSEEKGVADAAAIAASSASKDRNIWDLAKQLLEQSGVNPNDVNAVQKFSISNKRLSCAIDAESEKCRAYEAIEKDVVFRIKAKVFSDNAMNLSQLANTAAMGLRAVGANSEAVRLFSAVAVTAKSSSEIASIISLASGSISPMGWVNIASHCLDLGGSLGSMFAANGPDPDAERFEKIMQALQQISAQIEALNKSMLEQFARQDRQFAALTAYSQSSLALLQQLVGSAGFSDCQYISEFATQTGISNHQQFRTAISSVSNIISTKIPQCATWLQRGSMVTNLQANGTINELFSARLDILKRAMQMTAANAATNDALSGELSKTSSGYKSLYRLTMMSLPNNFAVGPEGQGAMGALMLVADSMLQTEKARIALAQYRTSGAQMPQDLPELLNGLGKVAAGASNSVSLHSAVSRPLNTIAIAEILQAALLVRGVSPVLAVENGAYRSPAKIDDARVLEKISESRPNNWMWELAPLAYIAIAQEVAYRGDFAVPLISELLASAEAISSCPEMPRREEGLTLCERFGKKWLDILYADALLAIKEFPEIRANIAMWRVRAELKRMLKPEHSDANSIDPYETSRGTSFRPEYGIALAQSKPRMLQNILPTIPVRYLKTNDDSRAFTNELEQGDQWFMELAGHCSGFEDPALNARVVCRNGTCVGNKVVKDPSNDVNLVNDGSLTEPVDSKSDEYARWQMRKRDVCVVAPLPSQEVLESGRWRGRAQFYQVIPLAQTFLTTVAHYINLENRMSLPDQADKQGGEAMLMSFLLKPKRIPFVRSKNQ